MYTDEGLRCLYSLLLTGGLEIKNVLCTDNSIEVTTTSGYILLDYYKKRFRVVGNTFYSSRVRLPAVGEYSLEVIGNIFNEPRS